MRDRERGRERNRQGERESYRERDAERKETGKKKRGWALTSVGKVSFFFFTESHLERLSTQKG